ncbi:MAG: hypothetical protein H0W39_04110 [Sphingomonas sp.]|nr:hypothetical protein [Sphingomonas sp.]
MAYELCPQGPVPHGPAMERIHRRFRAWQQLAPERRLEAVERALNAPANDLVDAFPIAL